MKQLVPALIRQHPTEIKSVGDRRPRRTASHSSLTHHCIAPPGALHPRLPIEDAHILANIPPTANPDHTDAEHIDALQLERLAQALLSKDHHDLTALAASNPVLIKEWQRAFQRQKQAAEHSARYWASAAAVLATAKGLGAAACKKSTH